MPGDDFTAAKNGQDKKGPWSTEEDIILKSCCQDEAGTELTSRAKWGEIADKIPGRCAKQCRERWEQNLKPSINKSAIDDREGHLIIGFVEQRGKKWAQIARELQGRSDNSVKNWYNGMVQKYKGRRQTSCYPAYDAHFSAQGQAAIDAKHGKNGGQRGSFGSSIHPGYHPYARQAPQHFATHPQLQPSVQPDLRLAPLRSDVHHYEQASLPQMQLPQPQVDQPALSQQVVQQPYFSSQPAAAYPALPLPGSAPAYHYQEYQHTLAHRPYPVYQQERRTSSSSYPAPPTPTEEPGLSHSRDATPNSTWSSPQTPYDRNPTGHLRHASQCGGFSYNSALDALALPRGEDKESSTAKMSLQTMMN